MACSLGVGEVGALAELMLSIPKLDSLWELSLTLLLLMLPVVVRQVLGPWWVTVLSAEVGGVAMRC